jgi:signal transduction histidine kinase
VFWPRRLVDQVLANLLINARQAARSVVEVGWCVHDGHVTVEVEDDGPGVPEDVLARVFDPFFTTRPVGEGTGLGLSVSRSIAQALGGSVEIGPRAGGRTGARARLKLPRRCAEEVSRAP